MKFPFIKHKLIRKFLFEHKLLNIEQLNYLQIAIGMIQIQKFYNIYP